MRTMGGVGLWWVRVEWLAQGSQSPLVSFGPPFLRPPVPKTKTPASLYLCTPAALPLYPVHPAACTYQRGRFRTARAQRAHSANYYGDYPGNYPENHAPAESCTINSKLQKFKHLMLAMGPRDLNSAPYSPVHCSSHSMTSFQSSELTELPVVENSQLFAQRAHSARYAPKAPFHQIFSAP